MSPPDPALATFLSAAAFFLGAFAFQWQAQALSAVSRKKIIPLFLWGEAHPSEIIIWTLIFLSVVLIALLLVIFWHQRDPGTGRFTAWFPGTLGKLEIPPSLAWLRVVAFIVLVAAPVGVQEFWVGRVFDHMEIVWLPLESKPEYTISKLRLLAVPRNPPGEPKGVMNPNWCWRYWYDQKADELVKKNDAQPTRIEAVPCVEPVLFVAAGMVLPCFLALLVVRAVRHTWFRGKQT